MFIKYTNRPCETRWGHTTILLCLIANFILICTACRPLGVDETSQTVSLEKTVAALSTENAELSALLTAGPSSTPSPRPTSSLIRPTPTPFIFEPTDVPTHPPTDLRITDLEIYEDYLWLSIGYEFQVLDISDPTDLRLVDSQVIGAEIADFEIDFPYLYVAAEDGLHMLDISNTTNMKEISTLKFPRPLEQVSVGPYYIYATDSWGWFHVVETNLPVPNNAWEIFFLGRYILLDDQYGYLLQSDELQLIDYDNPFDPQVISTFDMQGRFQKAWPRDKLLFLEYIPDEYLTLAVIDFFQTGGPTVRTLPVSSTVEAAVGNSMAFVSHAFGELHIFDLSDPSSAKLIGTFTKPGGLFTRVVVKDNFIFIVHFDLKVLAVDIHDPSTPVEVDSYSPFGG